MKVHTKSLFNKILFLFCLVPLLFFAFFYLHRYQLAQYCYNFTCGCLIACTFSLLAVSAYMFFSSVNAGSILLAVNCLWIIITQAIHGNRGFSYDNASFFTFLFFAFFVAGAGLDGVQRRRLFDIFLFFVCALIFLSAVCGIYTVFSGRPITYPAFLSEEIKLEVQYHPNGSLCFLGFFGFHRNISASFFVIALGFMACRFFRCKSRGRRGLIVLVSAVYYLSVAMQHSRSNYLAAAVCVSLWVGIELNRRFRKNGISQQILLAVCVLVSAVVLYAAFDPLNTFINHTASPFDYAAGPVLPTDAGNVVSTEFAEEPDEQLKSLSDNRKLMEDVTTLTGRTEIWGAIIPALTEKPAILLLGTAEGTEMELINKYVGDKKSHMHNTLLQQLMLAGLPGFLLYVSFLLLLLVGMLKEYFSPASDISLFRKSLICPMAAVMTWGIFEPAFNGPSLTSLGFFLAAGIFAGEKGRPGKKSGLLQRMLSCPAWLK